MIYGIIIFLYLWIFHLSNLNFNHYNERGRALSILTSHFIRTMTLDIGLVTTSDTEGRIESQRGFPDVVTLGIRDSDPGNTPQHYVSPSLLLRRWDGWEGDRLRILLLFLYIHCLTQTQPGLKVFGLHVTPRILLWYCCFKLVDFIESTKKLSFQDPWDWLFCK